MFQVVALSSALVTLCLATPPPGYEKKPVSDKVSWHHFPQRVVCHQYPHIKYQNENRSFQDPANAPRLSYKRTTLNALVHLLGLLASSVLFEQFWIKYTVHCRSVWWSITMSKINFPLLYIYIYIYIYIYTHTYRTQIQGVWELRAEENI
jgi:hypothetical protein